jgi:hypothetical protein
MARVDHLAYSRSLPLFSGLLATTDQLLSTRGISPLIDIHYTCQLLSNRDTPQLINPPHNYRHSPTRDNSRYTSTMSLESLPTELDVWVMFFLPRMTDRSNVTKLSKYYRGIGEPLLYEAP